jgi:hypothetical protein
MGGGEELFIGGGGRRVDEDASGEDVSGKEASREDAAEEDGAVFGRVPYNKNVLKIIAHISSNLL